MSETTGLPLASELDGALAQQIYNAGRIAGLQEASEFLAWLQQPDTGSSVDGAFASTRRVFAERAKRWWDTISDARVRSLVEKVPATPRDKRHAEADHSRFTLVFDGDIGALKHNVFDEDTPWGRASRAWIGDAVGEISRLRALLQEHGVSPDAPGTRSQGGDDAQTG